ncbi:MAG: tetratricopeptide repeat protein [Bacteroidia bacterium]
MKKTIKIICTLLFIVTGQITFAQSDAEKALAKGEEAVKLMDNGKVDESIALLEEAEKLDPGNYHYPYETAYAHFLKKDYDGTITILENLKNHKDAGERLFQLLGNTYDIVGKTDKAFEIYDMGLKKFPNSGMIYLEKGNVYWGKKDYEKALPFYEKGIELDPKFPSNYYRATLIYCSSTEEVWGMIYGEIFMNLERNSARTAEISKLLYDTYKSQIKFEKKNSMTVSFCQQMVMSLDNLKDTNHITLPFCMIYEPTISIAVAFEKEIDINSLNRIRTTFLDTYFSMGHNKTHPNILFDYQNAVKNAGHLEAYNHWILMKGDEKAFEKWESKNEDEWNSFTKWFMENGLEVNNSHKFYRAQY